MYREQRHPANTRPLSLGGPGWDIKIRAGLEKKPCLSLGFASDSQDCLSQRQDYCQHKDLGGTLTKRLAFQHPLYCSGFALSKLLFLGSSLRLSGDFKSRKEGFLICQSTLLSLYFSPPFLPPFLYSSFFYFSLSLYHSFISLFFSLPLTPSLISDLLSSSSLSPCLLSVTPCPPARQTFAKCCVRPLAGPGVSR